MEGNFSLSSTLPMDAEPQHVEIYDEIPQYEIYGEIYNETHYEIYYDFGRSPFFEPQYNFELIVVSSFICVVCIFGLVGNGIVIWLLGFRLKRNPFTTFILNLAVADFGVLITSVSIAFLNIARIHHPDSDLLFETLMASVLLFHCFYSASQFLLTAISIDRCVAVLFPLWYRCHRPEKLSTVLCFLVWLLSFLVQGSCVAFSSFIHAGLTTVPPMFYAVMVNAVVCLPLITISTLILFIRFCFKSQQRQRKKLFIVILLTLFFFLIFAFPLNVINLIDLYYMDFITIRYYFFIECGWICTSLNSFVNPLLYFLVGRKNRGLCRESLKFILRRVFIEEEEEEACREEPENQL